MTDILFGQSYYLRVDPKLWEAMQPYPPLGTLYAASYVRARGYDVALFDAMLAESEDEWAQSLDEHRPGFAVLYEDNFNYLSKMCLLRMREAAFKMMGMAKQRGCTVIAAGADATDHSDLYLEHGADFVVAGEGEETLLELLEYLTGKSNTPLGAIRGLAYRDSARSAAGPTVQRTPGRPNLRDLDALAFPAWDLVDVERYRSIWMERHGYYSMNMVTTRGCPYHCNWCAKPIWGQRYNSRSPENVLAEMKWLKETYHPDHLWFADDILGLKPGWIEKFAAAVRSADAGIPFKCLQRADLISASTAAALRQSGCKTVWVGAESGSQKILDAMEKGVQVDEIYSARENLRRHGIRACFFLQFGYPGETWEDIQSTITLVRETLPDDIGVSVSYPLPGTKFYSRVAAEMGSRENWRESGDLDMMFCGTYKTEFYTALHTALHYELNLRNHRVESIAERDHLGRLWSRVLELEKTSVNSNSEALWIYS